MAVEYYEEYETGAEYETAARTVTETDIVTFVNLFGFTEPLFIDMEFVKQQSLFGSRIAPGAFTFGLSEGLMIQAGLARGGLALLGIEDMQVPAPLRCGTRSGSRSGSSPSGKRAGPTGASSPLSSRC